MADELDIATLPSIAALPPTIVRQIGSSQVLIDPSSVVKELIDNALDARANAIFVDVAANTIDSIQVKDTGHGIPQEDRRLACRRYCTSKIRVCADLKEVGGKWLGFRGEALASMAEMSGVLEVTTRVEGEPVAVRMKYGRDGELMSSERASTPVGTTVKLTDFFKSLPARKQAALKHTTKWLAKMRRLMQAYSLARPTVRFSLRVLKAKSNKGDFAYAPKKDANIEDAVFKVIGKNCALQCDWTAMEADGFEVHAFLPKPNAIGSKIAQKGAFVSIDARPVSASRGTPKQLVAAFKKRLRKANPALELVKDPFFYMNIICPSDSYDPNIEPAKDDVLFEDGQVVVAAVDKLLMTYYPEAVIDVNSVDDEIEEDIPTSAQQPPTLRHEEPPGFSASPTPICEDLANGDVENLSSSPRDHPLWRSNMYGIDEEDLEFLSENQAPVIEEEEGRRAADISNPWTIARMSASFKGKKSNNGQLMSPAKIQGDTSMGPSSSAPTTLLHQQPSAELLTPQTWSRQNMTQASLDDELGRSVRRLPRPLRSAAHIVAPPRERESFDMDSTRRPLLLSAPPLDTGLPMPSPPFQQHAPFGSYGAQMNSPEKSPVDRRPNGDWFGQPMQRQITCKRTSQRKPRRKQHLDCPPFAPSASPGPQRVLHDADRLIENRLVSDNNTDIRDFFGQGRAQHRRPASEEPTPGHRNRWDNFTGQGITDQLHACAAREAPSEIRLGATSAEFHQPSPRRPRRGPCNVPGHKIAPKARSARRRTTDSAQQSKSSRLPLERVPYKYRIHNVVLPIDLSLLDVTKRMNTMDMTRNSPEWGYAIDGGVFDTFSISLTDGTLNAWARKVAQLLNHLYEQENDIDVFVAFKDGIHEALEGRCADADDGFVDIADMQLDQHDVQLDYDAELDDFERIGEWASQVLAAGNKSNGNGDTTVVETPITKARDGEHLADWTSQLVTAANNHEINDAPAVPATLTREIDNEDEFEDDEMLYV
ncbi:hypothetical protein K458DRAFT_369843 [Lentithecium fluviatile CBS 122367]|uniref:DNA mismatch repair protein S5 domain-containing protein n=1 Tax=Lentithecium fluviatile CBS 122367 TaxID=1168545 RepID=A0A6G1IXU4_9PLEO|nr:hypothetical protein K458DRAFT_369843 [Lentithecium fluviatile CBS 122367]